ncbi:MAG: hypothetical protein LUG16_08485 [Candidatus Gastranaerophilales bacterium]|nr:hypothetical protein [Candidatus Gastranaerophilales bacterium]
MKIPKFTTDKLYKNQTRTASETVNKCRTEKNVTPESVYNYDMAQAIKAAALTKNSYDSNKYKFQICGNESLLTPITKLKNNQCNTSDYNKISDSQKDLIKDIYKYINPGVFQFADLNEKTTREEILQELDKAKIRFVLSNIIPVRYADNPQKRDVSDYYDIIKSKTNEGLNIEKILLLIEAGKLSAGILQSYDKRTQLSDAACSDLNKILNSYIYKTDIQKEFIPEFENEKQAREKLTTGDVCSIQGRKYISIKLQNNKIKDLFITPKTYLELFPPFERYNNSQGAIEDCFLVATANSIYQNNASRHTILTMFKENDDGTVDVAVPGYKNENGNIILKNPKGFELKDVSNKIYNILASNSALAFACEGMRAIEALYAAKNKNDVNNEINKRVLYYNNRLQEMGDNSEIEKDNFLYTKSELELFLDFAKKYFNSGKSEQENELIVMQIRNPNCTFYMDDNVDYDNDGYSSEEKEYLKLLTQRYKEYLHKEGLQYTRFDAILPFNIYKHEAHGGFKIKNRDLTYLVGGNSGNAFNFFNLKRPVFEKNVTNLNDLLDLPNLTDRYIITCASSDSMPNLNGVLKSHTYIVKTEENGKNRKFFLVNPHQTGFKLPVLKEQLLYYFDNFYITQPEIE